MFETIKYEVDGDGVAIATIDLPGQSMNVANEQFIEDLEKFVDHFLADDSAKGVVIASGKKAFFAGADLRMLNKMCADAATAPAEDVLAAQVKLNKVLRKLETGGHSAKALSKGATTKPVAVAINGVALGAGFEIPLACHYRVASDAPGVQIGLPEVQIGLIPGAGGTQRTPRLAGIQNALQLATIGKPISAAKAKEQNLLHEIAPAGEIVARAKAWVLANPEAVQPWDKKGFKFPGGGGAMHPGSVQTFMVANAMAQDNTNHNYPAVERILSAVYEGSIVPMDTAVRIESKYFTKCLMEPQSRNMIRTLFVNKQAAEKGEARPAGPEKKKVGKLGVLGGGMMGAGITYVSAKVGMEVVLLDRELEYAEKGKGYSAGLLEKAVKRGKSSQADADALLARIKPTTDYNDLKDVDLIIEAVFEDPQIKADVIKKTEAVIGDKIIFASNTSTLPITGLAKNSDRPDQFIGIHFFSPVDKMPLVEIIPGEGTGDEALAAALDYVGQIKKTPIVVKDTRGFYCNSVVIPYLNESLLMVAEGVNPAMIENAAKGLGMPVGPLALNDETSLDLGYKIMNSTRQEMGAEYKPTGTEDLLEKFVKELGRLGRKSGGGLYEYPSEGGKYLWPGLADHYPLKDDQPTYEEVKDRLLYLQLSSAARLYADGVLSDPQSGDIGAIFGWGFAPWSGGPFSHIDTIGVDAYVRKADAMAQKYGERFAPPPKFRDMAEKGETLYADAA
ncbi:MAG: 3-hydroxyacyl-CoA dehydrogenase NAD-binding domain-containing protein [Pseudomonadota bacterium]